METKFINFECAAGSVVLRKDCITAIQRGYKEAQLVGEEPYYTLTVFVGSAYFVGVYATEEERDEEYNKIYGAM